MEAARELISKIDLEDRSLALQHFGFDDAWWLGSRLRDLGRERNAPLAIVVKRPTGWVFSCLLPGATQDNFVWIRRKFAVVERFERSSYAVGLMFRSEPDLLERWGLDGKTYALAGGGVPIRIAGVGIIGAVGVSGLPQEDDHRLAIEALADLKAFHESDGGRRS